MFIPLKITTEYSLLKSTIKVDYLVNFLKNNNIPAGAIVDTNLYGVMEFYQKMLKANLKPIIGLEIKINDKIIYLYAKNYVGYQNLLKIHTLKEFKELNIESLKKYLNNIKVVLPFISYDLLELFDDAYLGYQNDTEKIEALLKWEKVVYYKNACTLKKEDTYLLNYLEAMDKGQSVNLIVNDYSNNYLNLNVKDDDRESTINFIKDINIVFPEKKNYIPKYDENSESLIDALTHKGLNKRLNNNVSKVYLDRLEYELSVIKKMGFVDYFLIVYDYVLYAKKNNILVGPGRGSAAGSLVSFCLGITNVDPIKYNLLFERFLNPERVSMPDIDIDFEYTKRHLVIEYVREKYGMFNVAPIMTFGTLSSKQVLRDVARVMDLNSDETDQFVNLIEAKVLLKDNLLKENVQKYLNNKPEFKKLVDIALKLEGLKRHISTHAAGVVIASIKLDDVIPICKSAEGIMTGVTMEYLEGLGLLKMDFLALRNLTIISNVLELIKNQTGRYLDLNKIDLNDKDIFKLFSDADTEGIFQYESSGMKNLMRKLKPSTFSDLVASVALFRPGPMDQIDAFIARKYGKEKIIYIHPDLEGFLKETYGIIVYQEQVMQILGKIGGYTYAQADNIRRAMSKKKESVMLEDKKFFLESAQKRGYSYNVARDIYDLILKFANYGFNKAHSVSYALIGYQMAYLKTKFPLYFIANLLNMSIGSEIKTKEYLDEARRRGISILKPNINRSTNAYLITTGNSLMLPLSSIKNLGITATTAILEEREKGEFLDYLDFVSRVYGKSVNKKTVISLIEAGTLNSFEINAKTMIDNLDMAINYANLVSDLDASFVAKPELILSEDYSAEEKRNQEYNAYGFYLSNHPASKYFGPDITKFKSLASHFGKYVKCVVLVEQIRTIKTKKGEDMAFVLASDETGNGDLVLFPSVYQKIIGLKKGLIVEASGEVTKRFDSYQINVNYVKIYKE